MVRSAGALARSLKLVRSGSHGTVAVALVVEDDSRRRHSVGSRDELGFGAERPDLAAGQEHDV